MSAFSDWKCGAISEEEFRDLANREARQDAYLEEKAEREAYARHFNNRCPYTDEPCHDFECQDCEIEAKEREWTDSIDEGGES